MPLLRSRHDGNLALSASPSLLTFRRTSIALLTLFSLSTLVSVAPDAQARKSLAKPASSGEKLVGVQGWTSGSQTTIRIRPTTGSPLVAKVDRHQPVYIWGKYNGWYRVETPDHILGWVYHPYISSPKIKAVKEISQWKMNDASNKSGHQVMFGSAEQLKAYYNTYKAAGAAKGLALQGIYPSNGTFIVKNPTAASKVASASANALAPSLPKQPAAPKPVAAKPAAKKVAASKPAKKLTWRQQRHRQQLASRSKNRQQLNSKVGLKPKPIIPPAELRSGTVAPISPEELMRARDQYLQQRNSRLESNAALGGATVQPSSFNGKTSWNELWSEVARTGDLSPVKEADLQLADNEELKVEVIANAQVKPGATTNRGGSPRDRAKANLAKGMVNQALSYRGMPYRFGAASPTRGFDCSGLIYFMLRQRGYNPPRTAAGFSKYGNHVARKDLQPGDLVLFANTYKRGVSHIGIYMGNNKFVHAASTKSGVRVDSLTTGYFAKKYHSARRVQLKS